MFVPVFPIFRFWNTFVTFSIHVRALNQSHFEKENYFEFLKLPKFTFSFNKTLLLQPFFPKLQNIANENK